MKILYAGGGTMGSVSPLIAIHQKIVSDSQIQRYSGYSCLWLGTQKGPESEVVKKAGIRFEVIESGKLRRYFDLKNLLDFFRIIVGYFQSLYYVIKFQPDIVLTAGSFVAVPVAWASFLNNVPVFIHQQDVEVGLANKLMAPIAKKITVALEKSLDDFKKEKVFLVGNPVRLNCQPLKIEDSRIGVLDLFNFSNELPVILILGGGTGALAINELVGQSVAELTKFCNIIHITGKDKNFNKQSEDNESQYRFFDFLDEQKIYSAMQAAQVVVSRAGMSILTELAYFKKSTIIIPIPNSHQEKNAKYFANQNAAIYLSQKNLTTEKFITTIENLLVDKTKQKYMGEKMQQIFIDYSGEKYLDVVLK